MKTVVLEKSANPHTLMGNVKNVTEMESCMVINLNGQGVVSHGEHGTIATEHNTVVKYVQQEYNPVTKAMQKAFD